MINYQELGMEPSYFVGKLGVKIEVPRTLEAGQRKEEKELTALGLSIAYVLPSLANIYTEDSRQELASNSIYPRFDHPEVVAKTHESLKSLSLPDLKSDPEYAHLFVGGALHGLIERYREATPWDKPLNLIAAGALGIVGVNSIGALVMNESIVRAKETITKNDTARNIYSRYIATTQAHATILNAQIGEVIENIPTDHVPSQLLPNGLSLSGTPSR